MRKQRHYIVQTIAGIVLLFSLSVLALFKSSTATSASERRPLRQLPELTSSAVLSGRWMSEFESYTIDQFPFREDFRGMKATINNRLFGQTVNNKVFMAAGHLSEVDFPLNIESLDHAASVIASIYETHLAENNTNVYLSIIPDKNFYLAKESSIPVYDYDALFAYMRETLDFASYIDLTESLELDDYYNTDIHWRQEAITDTAAIILEAMHEKATLPQFTLRQHRDDFRGVYAGRYARQIPSEAILYVDSLSFKNLLVYDHENQKEIDLYQADTTLTPDPYSFFLHGPLSLITIDNPAATSDRELIIFRDSFASSLAPLLTSAYSRVTLVDIRYLPSALLDQFIDFDGQDVLFLYSSSILGKSSQLR